MGELTIAKSAGFCFGVTRAVNMVYEAIEKENVPIYTYGPIIHNDEVVKDMENNGVTVRIDFCNRFDYPADKKNIKTLTLRGLTEYIPPGIQRFSCGNNFGGRTCASEGCG